ncbi:MAG: ATP-binding protein [Gammaproteobacteria bacterium]
MTLSLQARLLLAAMLVLMIFTGLTGLALDKAFRQSAEAAMQDRLQGYLFTLLAAVDVDAEGIPRFSRTLPDARFDQPGSGLYARVDQPDHSITLSSPSLLGIELPPLPHIPVGQYQYDSIVFNAEPHYRLAYRVRWEVASGRDIPLDFQISVDLKSYQQQIAAYRRNLWGWLGGAVVLLLLIQAWVLRWSLKPLRKVAADLALIEAGKAERIGGRYPKELQQLTDKLNDLLDHTRSQLKRYRDSLGNMAHSLKTPLAILANALSLKQTDTATSQQVPVEAQEQLQRIRQIIDYQLQRAATAGQTSLGSATPLQPLVVKIIHAMQKVYADKPVQTENLIGSELYCRCDAGDVMEVLGNLIENAYKWCRQQIRITAEPLKAGGVEICIEDDGPGIPAEVREQVLQRGQRADPTTAGHGIGLAMVHEIVLLYGGQLKIETSPLGGTAISIQLP